MGHLTYDYKAIVDSVSCFEIADVLGIEQRKRGKNTYIRCPEHVQNTGKLENVIDNCVLYESGYHCFSCQANGNVINLVQHVMQVSAKEACKFICEYLGGDVSAFCSNSSTPWQMRLPLTPKELGLLGLCSKATVLHPKFSDICKIPKDEVMDDYELLPDLSRYLDEESGAPEYVYGEKECVMLQTLYQEEPDVFFDLVYGKLEELEEVHQFIMTTDFLNVIDEAYKIPYGSYKVKQNIRAEMRECKIIRQKLDHVSKRHLPTAI